MPQNPVPVPWISIPCKEQEYRRPTFTDATRIILKPRVRAMARKHSRALRFLGGTWAKNITCYFSYMYPCTETHMSSKESKVKTHYTQIQSRLGAKTSGRSSFEVLRAQVHYIISLVSLPDRFQINGMSFESLLPRCTAYHHHWVVKSMSTSEVCRSARAFGVSHATKSSCRSWEILRGTDV